MPLEKTEETLSPPENSTTDPVAPVSLEPQLAGASAQSEPQKIPRYIPPKLPDGIVAVPVRREHQCLKKKLIIGNVSKWIPVSERDDSASHKWMVGPP